jgi:hypothetical protein
MRDARRGSQATQLPDRGQPSPVWAAVSCDHSTVGRREDRPHHDRQGRCDHHPLVGRHRSGQAEGTGNDELERLAFLSKVSEGLRQAEAGKVVSHEEVKRRFLVSRLDGQVDRTTPGPQL